MSSQQPEAGLSVDVPLTSGVGDHPTRRGVSVASSQDGTASGSMSRQEAVSDDFRHDALVDGIHGAGPVPPAAFGAAVTGGTFIRESAECGCAIPP